MSTEHWHALAAAEIKMRLNQNRRHLALHSDSDGDDEDADGEQEEITRDREAAKVVAPGTKRNQVTSAPNGSFFVALIAHFVNEATTDSEYPKPLEHGAQQQFGGHSDMHFSNFAQRTGRAQQGTRGGWAKGMDSEARRNTSGSSSSSTVQALLICEEFIDKFCQNSLSTAHALTLNNISAKGQRRAHMRRLLGPASSIWQCFTGFSCFQWEEHTRPRQRLQGLKHLLHQLEGLSLEGKFVRQQRTGFFQLSSRLPVRI